MGRLIIHPRAATATKLRLWVCAQDYVALPSLTWRVDQHLIQPTWLRPLSPTRRLPAGSPQNFTGLIEFTGQEIIPRTTYLVNVTDGVGGLASLTCRTLPEAVPSSFEAPFNVLLVSCFHAAEDNFGLAGQLVKELKSELQPHLTLLMGDQVYLDLPTLRNFKDDPAWLLHRFEESYLQNWIGEIGYANVLRAAPSASIPDDHEYWNNFPHPSPFIENTYSKAGREHWQAAAQAMYSSFQQPLPNSLTEAFELNVHPLSFFLLDTRTFRKEDRSQTVNPAMRQQFSAWVTRIIKEGLYGVVVTGQSFFDEPAVGLSGKIGDRTLANYQDYAFLCEQLLRLVHAGRPALCLTGDVHWGRVFEAQERYLGQGKVYEIISSPSSLVSTIGNDQIKQAGNWVKSLVGQSDPWPRHADAVEPAALPLNGRLHTVKTLHQQKGNHVVMLSFRQNGFGLNLDITYHTIATRGQRIAPISLPTVKLAPHA